jgi:hypothetical protein
VLGTLALLASLLLWPARRFTPRWPRWSGSWPWQAQRWSSALTLAWRPRLLGLLVAWSADR